MKATADRHGALRVAGLFAGIGGIELGLKSVGMETSLLCEIDPGARRVLEGTLSGVDVYEDVGNLSTSFPQSIWWRLVSHAKT